MTRPKTRRDCIDGPRPCPYVGCRYHLASYDAYTEDRIDVNLSILYGGGDTCALDVADRGSHSLSEVAEKLGGISKQRVHEISREALRKLRIGGKL